MSKPKSHKEFIQPAADELECSEVLVEDVIEFFYSFISKEISAMKHNRLEVCGLGKFVVCNKQLETLISKLEGKLGKIKNPKSEQSFKIKHNLEEDLHKAINMRNIVLREKAEKASFIEEKRKRRENE